MLVNCRVCGSDQSRLICIARDNMGRVRDLHHVSCDTCGSVFIGDHISNDDLAEAYAAYDEDEYYRQIAATNDKKLRRLAARIQNIVGHDAHIIDIGCGNGALLSVLKEQGFSNLYGHEIPGHTGAARQHAKQIYEDFDLSSVPTKKFDIAIMVDVMEHVPDPTATLHKIAAILKPAGAVYFHTPAVSRLDRFMHICARSGLSRIAGEWQRGRTSILHLQNYSVEGIRIMLERTGFEVKDIRTVNELTWPISMYVESYLLRKFPFRRPLALALSPFFKLLLGTSINRNKALVVAQLARSPRAQ